VAAVLSSCGIQNQAGDSSSAAKTKNFALLSDKVCFDSFEERAHAIHDYVEGMDMPHLDPMRRYWDDLASEYGLLRGDDLIFTAQIGGCTQQFASSSAEVTESLAAVVSSITSSSGEVSATTPSGNPPACLPQAWIDSGIAGYQEQINKTFPADWSKKQIDDYKAEMQKGIDAFKRSCVVK